MLGVLLKIALGFGLLMLLAIGALVFFLLFATVPMTDALNTLFRMIGLAGPSPGGRAAGARGTGTVDGPFVPRPEGQVADGRVVAGGEIWNATCRTGLAGQLAPGDRVEVVYGEDLRLEVVGPARDDQS